MEIRQELVQIELEPIYREPPGEVMLVLNVLHTYVEDLHTYYRKGAYKEARKLMVLAEHQWTEHLCGIAGIDYSDFIARLRRIQALKLLH